MILKKKRNKKKNKKFYAKFWASTPCRAWCFKISFRVKR